MFSVLSLVVCLSSDPLVCRTVVPSYARVDTGTGLTYFECLGANGQDVARRWLAAHPGYELRKIRCSISNDPERLRRELEAVEA